MYDYYDFLQFVINYIIIHLLKQCGVIFFKFFAGSFSGQNIIQTHKHPNLPGNWWVNMHTYNVKLVYSWYNEPLTRMHI